MATVREVLYQHTKKFSARAIARSFGMSKTTVRKYLKLATTHGYSAKINDEELQEIAINWTLDKFHPYLGIKFVPIKETCINQILVCS